VKPDNQIRIRPFSSDDYESIIDLWRASGLTIKASDSLPELEKLCAFNPNRFLIAEANDEGGAKRIVGAVVGAFDGRRGWIYHLAVLQDVRRTGIGAVLIRQIEQCLHAEGAIKVNLLVEPENVNAAQFYKALGYSEVPFVFFIREL
jgi:ribosomal protein S18 acetylase RimI-like enzyme